MAEVNKMFVPDWTNVVSEGRNEMVFEGKNKDYGAFVIRKEYNKTVTTAVWISVGIFVFFLILPLISAWISGMSESTSAETKEVVIDLTEPPPVDPTEPPPPPPPPPPVMETIKFVPPKVVDEEIKDEEIPPPQEKLSETTVATVTQEGDPDALNLPDIGDNSAIGDAKEEIFTVVEQMPSFPGGDAEMMKYLQNNIHYPQMAKEAGISGRVYLKFAVDKEGNIKDIEVLKGISGYPEFEKEALRVVKSMPTWKPGKQNGRPVSCYFNLPVGFTLR